jgi:hypothetical protein
VTHLNLLNVLTSDLRSFSKSQPLSLQQHRHSRQQHRLALAGLALLLLHGLHAA